MHDSQYQDLAAVERSIDDLVALLRKRCGLRDEALTVLLDPSDADDLLDAVWRATENAETFVFFFLGHATATMGTHNLADLLLGTRALADTGVARSARQQALRFSEVCEVVDRRNIKRVLTVLDCCFSGRAQHPLRALPGDTAAGLLASAAYEGQAVAEPGAVHTRYTGALIDVLEEGIPGLGPRLTVANIADAVRRRLGANPRPQELPNRDLWESPFTDNPAWDPEQRPPRRPEDTGTAVVNFSPWPGMYPYQVQDERFFFGRDHVLGRLLDSVRGVLDSPGPLLLTGPSGTGKTSLLQAGLLPALRRGDLAPGAGRWPVLLMRPGTDPMAALHAEVMRQVRPGTAWPSEPPATAQSAVELLRRFIAEVPLEPGASATRVLILVDPLEETLADTDGSEKHAVFFRTLVEATRPADGSPPTALVLAAVRSDYARAAAERLGARVTTVRMASMTGAELRQTVEETARAAGLLVEPAVIHWLLRDAGVDDGGTAPDGILPLVSHSLYATWLRREGHWLTAEGYGRTGGITGAVATTAQEVFARLDEAGRAEARALLMHLAVVDRERRTYSRRRARQDMVLPDGPTAGSARDALHLLADARLLVLDGGWVEVAHESLFTSWPQFRDWIERYRDELLLRQQLDEAARTWEASGRITGGFTDRDGTAAFRTARWTDAGPVRLDRRQREFLAASEDRARRRRRARRAALALFVALVLTGISLLAWGNYQSAARERAQRAEMAQQLITQADSLRGQDPRTALLLEVAAAEAGAARQAVPVMVKTLQGTAYDGTFDPPRSASGARPAVHGLAYAPDGHQLAAATATGTVLLADPTRHPIRQAGSLSYGHGADVSTMAYAPGGTLLAVGGSDGNVKLASTTDQEHRTVGTLDGGPDGVTSMAWAPDGDLVAIGDRAGATALWDVSNPSAPVRLRILRGGGPVTAVTFSASGRLLAAAGSDGTVAFWDLRSPDAPRRNPALRVSDGSLPTLAFSPVGSLLAVGTADRTAQIWDLADPQRPVRRAMLTGHTAAVRAVAFSPDGRMLATASQDTSAVLWKVARDGTATRTENLLGHSGPLTAVAFAPDGHTLATGSDDGTAIQWETRHHQTAVALDVRLPPTRPATALAVSPRDGTLSVARADGSADLVDERTDTAGHAPRTLPGDGEPLAATTFTADGDLLATVTASGTVTLWSLTEPLHPVQRHRWPTTTTVVRAAALTRAATGHGPLLAVAGSTGVGLWDLSDPTRPVGAGEAPGRGAATLAFTADGKRLAVGYDNGSTALFDTAASGQPAKLGSYTPSGTAAVLDVAFSPDGSLLATAAADGNTRLLSTARPSAPRLLGTLRDATTAVRFSATQGLLVALDSGGTPVVWDVSEPTDPTRILKVTDGAPDARTLGLGPDGTTLAVAGANGRLQVWSLSDVTSPARLSQTVCTLVGDWLSRRQWRHYAPGLPYHDLCA
ncbi:hypothetical protein ABZ960_02050 [Streptomyces pseudovenezuelae]|uniref:nSTAND1 domain-containing NTPase n=1 Tax=Streptomyces pseudovenezuelae TaxID=67350 RepID=UPI0034A23DD2